MERDVYKFMWFVIYMIMLTLTYKLFSPTIFTIYVIALILSHLVTMAKDLVILHKSMITLIEMLNEYFSKHP